MIVIIGQSRDDRGAFEIHDSGVLAGERADRGVVPHCQILIASNGERLPNGEARIDRDDLAVVKNSVRRGVDACVKRCDNLRLT